MTGPVALRTCLGARLLHATVAENIRFFRLEAESSEPLGSRTSTTTSWPSPTGTRR